MENVEKGKRSSDRDSFMEAFILGGLLTAFEIIQEYDRRVLEIVFDRIISVSENRNLKRKSRHFSFQSLFETIFFFNLCVFFFY